ncbi:MAG TPA: hypothetical protein VGM69_07775 [Chloroflexota bacterium]
MTTFRLTMPQFQGVLSVVLGPTVPDDLSNKVLMVCTRPRDGVTEVALEDDEARQLVEAVTAAQQENPALRPIAKVLLAQMRL